MALTIENHRMKRYQHDAVYVNNMSLTMRRPNRHQRQINFESRLVQRHIAIQAIPVGMIFYNTLLRSLTIFRIKTRNFETHD